MGAAAVLFSLGCFRLLLGLGLGLRAALVGYALAAGASVLWSVEYISPDLLVSGLICLAVGEVSSARWAESWKTAVLAGVLWGGAYLAKAVAFPLAFGMSGLLALLWCARQPGRWRQIARQLLVTLSAFLLVASPWIDPAQQRTFGGGCGTAGSSWRGVRPPKASQVQFRATDAEDALTKLV